MGDRLASTSIMNRDGTDVLLDPSRQGRRARWRRHPSACQVQSRSRRTAYPSTGSSKVMVLSPRLSAPISSSCKRVTFSRCTIHRRTPAGGSIWAAGLPSGPYTVTRPVLSGLERATTRPVLREPKGGKWVELVGNTSAGAQRSGVNALLLPVPGTGWPPSLT